MAASEGVKYSCFVGGLSWATGERQLEAAFRPFGGILDTRIINERETGRSRGFGFVTYASEQSMRDAIQGMNGRELGGRIITVNEARPRLSGVRDDSGSGSGNSDRRVPRSGMNQTGDDTFASFFEKRVPRSGMNQMGHDTFASFFEKCASFPSHGDASTHASQLPRKAAPIQYQLACNLADLYKGATKKMKISRELLGSSGRRTVVEEILTVDIKPGWKKGTKITFAEKGHEAPHVTPADIVFVIDEKPHDEFTREGNDLVLNHKISLAQDWTRYSVHVTTLDGRNLTIPIKGAVKPGYEEVVAGEGMPISKDPSMKGKLRIRFNISFPS